MDRSLIGIIRGSRGFVRVTASLVVGAFLFVFYSPGLLAAKQAIEQPQATTARSIQGESDEEKLANTLQAIKEHVSKNKDKIAKRVEKEGGFFEKALDVFGLSTLESENIAELMSLNGEMLLLHDKVMANFKAIEAKLKARGLPEEILQRHYDAVKKYYTEYNKLRNYIDQLKGAGSLYEQETAVEALDEWLQTQQFKPEPQPFDPNDLPNKSLRPQEDNKPKTTKQEFTNVGLRDNPRVRLAALGDFTFDKLPDASDPAFLAETVEVRLSDAIKAKAAELGHDPIQIHNWVHNNTEWLPTWGSMQDSDLTLFSLKGNAFDIASLEIALLRASGIPSRYVHGTIEVPADKFMNWAGGFTDIIAAGTFVRSGGVPAVGVTIGGTVQKVRMEHIWVEAAIDYEPSRGAVNRDADTWVEMDSAFKQYEFLTGLDPVAISGLDLQPIAESYVASGIINEQEGWIQGLNDTILQNPQPQVQQALQQFITNNIPNPTAEDIIGGRKTIIQKQLVLPSALPNPILVTGTRYASIPAPLQHRIAFAFATDFLTGRLVEPISFPWPVVNNQKVTVSFSPATPADEETVRSFLLEGDITDLSQIPTQIPAYLINVIPQLRINGELKKQGSPMILGTKMPLALSITMPAHGTNIVNTSVTAGSHIVIPVVGGSVSNAQLDQIKSSINRTKLILESQNTALIPTLTSEELYGDIFYAGSLGYFATYLSIGKINSLQQNSHIMLAPSVGTYGYVPSVESFFGVPRIITTGGAQMDLFRIVTVNGTSDGDKTKQVNFVKQMGILGSALEHAIPEQEFSTPENPIDGVSAVKILSKAAALGQRIYTITAQNQAVALPNLNHRQATMNAIRAALAAGKEVTTHTDPISVPGYTGSGYIIIDPETGDGGYIIEGGLNGGLTPFLQGLFMGIALGFLIELLLVPGIGLAAVAGFLVVFTLILAIIESYKTQQQKDCFRAGVAAGLALASVLIASTPILVSLLGYLVAAGVGGSLPGIIRCGSQ